MRAWTRTFPHVWWYFTIFLEQMLVNTTLRQSLFSWRYFTIVTCVQTFRQDDPYTQKTRLFKASKVLCDFVSERPQGRFAKTVLYGLNSSPLIDNKASKSELKYRARCNSSLTTMLHPRPNKKGNKNSHKFKVSNFTNLLTTLVETIQGYLWNE